MIQAMTAAALLPELDDLTAREAGRWVAAALAEAAALHERDAQRYPLDGDPAKRRRAEHLHAAWADWVAGAADVLERVRALPEPEDVAGFRDLRVEVAVARANDAMTPSEFRRRAERIRRGQVRMYGRDELRREVAERASSQERPGTGGRA